MNTEEICSKKKPHFVSEARILRQYERSEQVTCHVLFPLGTDLTKIRQFSYHSDVLQHI